MSEYDLPMPPTVIYRGLRLKTTFHNTDETLRNHLGEMVDDELVLRVDPSALENGSIVTTTDTSKRCYYVISDAGRGRVE